MSSINDNNERQQWILTNPEQWESYPAATRSYWIGVAMRMPWGTVVCTGRPPLPGNEGITPVRRASTEGKYGKSADMQDMDVPGLVGQGWQLIDVAQERENRTKVISRKAR